MGTRWQCLAMQVSADWSFQGYLMLRRSCLTAFCNGSNLYELEQRLRTFLGGLGVCVACDETRTIRQRRTDLSFNCNVLCVF